MTEATEHTCAVSYFTLFHLSRSVPPGGKGFFRVPLPPWGRHTGAHLVLVPLLPDQSQNKLQCFQAGQAALIPQAYSPPPGAEWERTDEKLGGVVFPMDTVGKGGYLFRMPLVMN